MKQFVKDFKEFAMKGNVIDLAVGVVMGGAFGKIVTSIVNDIIMPFVLLITGSGLAGKLELRPASLTQEAIYLDWGNFLQSIIDFTIIAFSIFLVVRLIGKFKKKEAVEEAAAEPVKSDEVVLLEGILNELRNK